MGLRKQALLVILFCLLLLIPTGCWNRRELDTVAIVAGAGIDLDDGSGKYVVTVQVVLPSASKTSSGGDTSGQGKGVSVVSGTGASVFEAIRSVTTQLSRKLFWPHNQIVVIGDSTARQGIRPILDFFLRDSEPRPTTWLLVADGQARDIIQARLEEEKIPAIGIGHLMESVRASSQTATATLHDFAEKVAGGTTAPIAARISLAEDSRSHVQAVGTAVFKDDKLVGEMNGKETRGLLWVTSKVGSGIITVTLPTQQGTSSVEIIRSFAQIAAEKQNGRIVLKVSVFMEGNLGTESAPANADSPEQVDLLGDQVRLAIREEIMAAIAKARTFHTDVFGFGSAIERRYPKDWHQLKKDWDQQFSHTEVILNIQVNVRRIGLLNRSVIPSED